VFPHSGTTVTEKPEHAMSFAGSGIGSTLSVIEPSVPRAPDYFTWNGQVTPAVFETEWSTMGGGASITRENGTRSGPVIEHERAEFAAVRF
jgi:hypothetical protein